MTDWTDKKRGYSGDRGNLGSHINPMSFNRKTRELLGDLFQTKDQRVTPDGNVMVKAFGKYEKFKFETVKKDEPTFDRECLLILTRQGSDYWIMLVVLSATSYQVLCQFKTNITPNSIAWDYEKSCFIVIDGNTDKIYEITKSGVTTLKATITSVGFDYYPTPYILSSYGRTADNYRLWLGLYDREDGYSLSYDITTIYRSMNGALSVINGAEGVEQHYDTSRFRPKLMLITYNDVRILRPHTDISWGWQAYLQTCAVDDNKFAFIFDPDIDWMSEPMVIRESTINYNDVIEIASDGHKYVPESNMDSNLKFIKQSEIFSSGGESSFWTLGWQARWTHWGSEADIWPSLIQPLDGVGTAPYEYYESGLRYINTPIYFHTGTELSPALDWPLQVSEAKGWLGYSRIIFDPPLSKPVSGGTYVDLPSPDGLSSTPVEVPVGGELATWTSVLGAWYWQTTRYAASRETYSGITHLKDKYVVVGRRSDYYDRVFVTNDNGSDLYEITLPVASPTSTVLGRAVMKV